MFHEANFHITMIKQRDLILHQNTASDTYSLPQTRLQHFVHAKPQEPIIVVKSDCRLFMPVSYPDQWYS